MDRPLVQSSTGTVTDPGERRQAETEPAVALLAELEQKLTEDVVHEAVGYTTSVSERLSPMTPKGRSARSRVGCSGNRVDEDGGHTEGAAGQDRDCQNGVSGHRHGRDNPPLEPD
jgi:hypothetical protein